MFDGKVVPFIPMFFMIAQNLRSGERVERFRNDPRNTALLKTMILTSIIVGLVSSKMRDQSIGQNTNFNEEKFNKKLSKFLQIGFEDMTKDKI